MNLFNTIGQFNRQATEGEKPTKDLSNRLNDHLGATQYHPFEVKEETERAGDLRISRLSNPCIRQLVFKILRPDIKDPPPPPGLRKIFDQGKATHSWWQNNYYGPMGSLIGGWKCSICKETTERSTMPKHRCQNRVSIETPSGKIVTSCEDLGSYWKYVEPEIRFEMHGFEVTGHCDGEMALDDMTVLEMKTMDSDRWKRLACPVPKDVVQSSCYAHELDCPKILLSYIEKNTWATKDYLIDADQTAWGWLDKQIGVIRMLVDQQSPFNAPRTCKNKKSSAARACGFADLCFNE